MYAAVGSVIGASGDCPRLVVVWQMANVMVQSHADSFSWSLILDKLLAVRKPRNEFLSYTADESGSERLAGQVALFDS